MQRTILFSALLFLSATCIAQPGNSSQASKAQPVTSSYNEPRNTIDERTDRLAMLGNGNNANSELHTMRTGNIANNGTLYIQDNGLREARYNSMVRPPSRNQFIDAGTGTVEARFAPPFTRFFYYCTSEYSRRKCDDTLFRKIATTPSAGLQDRCTIHEHSLACHCACAQYSYVYPFCITHLVRDIQLSPDNTTRTSNSGQYFSFDGRVVYGTDTLYGIITIINKEVSIEHSHIKDIRTSSYSLADAQLRAITIYKGPKELHLVRLSPHDRHLSRLVHAGRLTLYDRSYSFLTAANVSRHLTITSANGYDHIRTSDELAAAINSKYQLNIHADELSRTDLITLLNRLN